MLVACAQSDSANPVRRANVEEARAARAALVETGIAPVETLAALQTHALAHAPDDSPSATPSQIPTGTETPTLSAGGTAAGDPSPAASATPLTTYSVDGLARVGLLYFLDSPAHRQAVLDWLAAAGASVAYENARFGYVEAELSWMALGKLVATGGKLGLDAASVLKVEVQKAEVVAKTAAPDLTGGQSSFLGAVHSAGYGAKVTEFREQAAKDLGIEPSALEGQGTTVAVYDGGIDLRWKGVYGNRIRDFLVAEESVWLPATQPVRQYLGIPEPSSSASPGPEAAATPAANDPVAAASSLPAIPGLEDVQGNPELRIASLAEAGLADLNRSGSKNDALAIAVYRKNGAIEARVRPSASQPFGVAVRDFGWEASQGRVAVIDLATGGLLEDVAPAKLTQGAAALKLRENADGSLSVAALGLPYGAAHGIANLHMVGGDYSRGGVSYRGVAPKTQFLAMQAWKLDDSNYGEDWLPLARSILQAVDAGADVLDLDIYTPGTRGGNDLLSSLLCRIVGQTNVVPVIAAHNYGPLPDTVQSLAQSPCAIGVGASISSAAYRYGYSLGSVNPVLLGRDDAVQTAFYSGRGFGMNGLMKPDILSPAYAYTAYGSRFTRFGGTSGATPATSGMVALLKQAARMKGAELGFDQVRFLLQAGSDSVSPEHPRDGYGYTNLARSWEVFLASQAAGLEALAPFRLAGQKRLAFEGRPDRASVSLNLERPWLPGTSEGPEPMVFTVRLAGDSSATGIPRWLKLVDPSTGQAKDEIQLDAPLPGQTQKLSLWIDPADSVWAALPPGDHVAIIEGVRQSLAGVGAGSVADSRVGVDPSGSRAVDFLQPISIAKPRELLEGGVETRPLYVHEFEILILAARPGDRVTIEGESRCLGSKLGGAFAGDASATLMLLSDHASSYSHASDVHSSYNDADLDGGSLQITVDKPLLRLAIGRYSQLSCDGAMSARVQVRRAGFDARVASPSIRDDGKSVTLEATGSLTNTGMGLASELARYESWSLSAKNTRVLLTSGPITAPSSIPLPAGARSARVVGGGANALAATDATGKVLAQSASDSSAYVAGFELTGPSLAVPEGATALQVISADGAITLEVEVDTGAKASASAGKCGFGIGESCALSVSVELPSASLQGLAPFVSARAEVSLAVESAHSTGDQPGISAPTGAVWSGTISLASPVR